MKTVSKLIFQLSINIILQFFTFSSYEGCPLQVPISKLPNLTAQATSSTSVVIQWTYDCKGQDIAWHWINGTALFFKVELCPVTTNTTCNPQNAITQETLKSRLLFDSLKPDTRYLVRIYAPIIQPDINICVRTRVAGSESDLEDSKKSWPKVAISVTSGVVGVAFLIGLLHYTVRKLRLLQDRRSSLMIKVLSDDKDGKEYQMNFEEELPYKSVVLPVESAPEKQMTGKMVNSLSFVELNLNNLAATNEQNLKFNQITTQSSYVTLPALLIKNA